MDRMTRRMNLVMTDEEWEMLVQMARTDGRSASSVVRKLIKDGFHKLGLTLGKKGRAG